MTKSITFTEGEGAPHPGLAQGPAKGKTGPGRDNFYHWYLSDTLFLSDSEFDWTILMFELPNALAVQALLDPVKHHFPTKKDVSRLQRRHFMLERYIYKEKP